MIDLKLIRETPEILDQALISRGALPVAAQLQSLDEEIRQQTNQLQQMLTRRNELAKAIGQAKSKGEDAAHLMREGESLKSNIPALEERVNSLRTELEDKLVSIPNIPQDSVPIGKDENDNVEKSRHGTPNNFPFTPKEHFDIGENLGLLDFEQTAKISGARFSTLKGDLARMERALRNFMLDNHINEFGYQEMATPFLVRPNAPFGVGQLPKFEEDLFKTTNDYYLISTSEVTLTNMVADMIVAEEELPLRFTAYSHCFRSEAGSAGRDTRGMIRQHQFSKVELVSITTERDSASEHDRMLAAAESILKKLELPYRVITLCTGDMGFCSSKTYDIEVWLPGQNKYREISSCSNCTDFQARRMMARYKDINTGKNKYVHTLNGSGLAIGRTIVAILENYQQADGSVIIPKNLVPYMNGITKLSK